HATATVAKGRYGRAELEKGSISLTEGGTEDMVVLPYKDDSNCANGICKWHRYSDLRTYSRTFVTDLFGSDTQPTLRWIFTKGDYLTGFLMGKKEALFTRTLGGINDNVKWH